ncbi:SEC14-like protein 2 [Uloborus diversus]|uniref:SEC14-like protein 2 n=1 Tax=Uloborus diversus TaxID=327109 RepID=UPI00240A0C7E|nr:SEC14-like protein 2 [Uloborus diversus]
MREISTRKRKLAREACQQVSMEAPENLPKLLNQFRENLSDILTPDHTDAVLLKWLRARNYDLEKAERNFREVDTNRKIFEINTLLETYVKPEVVEKYERTACLGFAKDGTPVRYCGFADFRGFIMAMSSYDMCLFFSYYMEMDYATLRQENKKNGGNLHEMTYIFDMEDFSLQDCVHKCVIETGMDFMRLVQDHYPEAWKHVLIVNAPGYFYRAFNFLKPIFRPTLLEKIQVISKHQTKEVLLKYIDEDVLPAFLGGKRVDSNGDPRCGELFPAMKHTYFKIPSEYYINNRITPLSREDPGVTCVTVGARSVLNVSLRCSQASTKYRFHYRSEGGSLSVTIFYREDL